MEKHTNIETGKKMLEILKDSGHLSDPSFDDHQITFFRGKFRTYREKFH